MANARNTRTTHPRKAARRQRAAARFAIKRSRQHDAGYMSRKQVEAIALGLRDPLPITPA